MNHTLTSTKHVFVSLIFVVVGVLFFAGQASAATPTWDGGGGDGIWSTCANWDNGDTCPVAGDDVTISGVATVSITASLGLSLGSLTLGDDVDDGSATVVDVVLNFNYDAYNTGGAADPLVVTNAVTVNADAQITHAAATTGGASPTIYITAGSMTIDNGGSIINGGEISVDAKGCQADGGNGQGPSASNVCTDSTAGYGHYVNVGAPAGGGGGYGGAGGFSGYGAGGITYGSATVPDLYGSSTGGGGGAGHGGGLIVISVTGTMTLDGDITANGGNGNGGYGSGGSGGGIGITTGVINGSGNIFANGGDSGASGAGGGGGGGRIALTYDSGSFPVSSTVLTVSGGTKVGTGIDGSKGSVYTYNTTADAVTIYHGFRFGPTDHSVTTWTRDSSVEVQDCEAGAGTPSVTVSGTLTLDGTINCSNSVTSLSFTGATVAVSDGSSISVNGALNITATSDMADSVGTSSGVTWATTATNSDITLTIPDGETTTFTNSTITVAAEGEFVIDATGGSQRTSLVMDGTTAVNGNVRWLELANLTLDANTSIVADSKGCQGDANEGQGPNGSNVCTDSTGGFGNVVWLGVNAGAGGGYGGAGGNHSSNSGGGSTYETASAPTLFGSSGGGGSVGGHGGGLVYINATGTVILDGDISADGGNGSAGYGGGGSGGAVYINTGILTCTDLGSDGCDEAPVITAVAGNGISNGGGGGGGRIALIFSTDNTDLSSRLSTATHLANGTSSGSGYSGSDGTLFFSLVFTSATTSVSTGSLVDRLTVVFNQNVTIVDAGDGFDAITLSASSGSCTTNSGGGDVDYSASGTTTLVLQITCTAGANTGITVDPVYATAGTSTVKDDATTTEMANAATVTGLDGAAPIFVSAEATTDTNVQITMSEPVVTATFGNATEWTATGFTSSGVAVNAGLIDVTVSSLGSTAFTASDFAFATLSGVIQDGAAAPNSAVAFSGKTIADGQAPAIANFMYSDADNNGTIDTIMVGFSETVTDSSILSASNLLITVDGDFNGMAFGGDVNDLIVSSGNSQSVTLGTESTVVDTADDSSTIAISTQGVFSLIDGSGNTYSTAEVQSGSVGDGAAPVISSFEYKDSDSNGKIDQFIVTFSEAVDSSSVLTPAGLIFSTAGADVGDFTGAAFGASSSNSISGDGVTTATITLGTEASAIDTAEGSGTISIDSQGTFSLVDDTGSANTNTTLAAQSQATYIDGAGPVLASSSPADADVSVQTNATVVLTFSEPIATGTFAYTCCGAGTDPGRSGAWTVSNTVYTITPTSNWTNVDVITIDVTVASDVASIANTFVGAATGIADPFSFTIAAAGGGSVPTPGTGPANSVTTSMVLTPNGGEHLSGNSAFTITWLASGDNLATISIYSSTDNGQTYTLVASGEANDGSYVWTTPNTSTSQARVRVDAVTASGGTLVSDASNGSFSISSVTVVPEPETSEPELVGPVLAQMTSPEGEILDIREGSLFRGVELSGVYKVVNGTRYVFPNEETFFTHYADFSGVQQVNDDQLRELPSGGRMIMATGSLIKVQSDNRVFVVQDDGTIRHIPDEATAIAMYGTSWASLVHDVSVVFWFDYTVGDSLPMI